MIPRRESRDESDNGCRSREHRDGLMRSASSRWTEITPTQYPWEREALAYVRERLPDHDPYRAFALFEFIASDRSINEVDLLAIVPFVLLDVPLQSLDVWMRSGSRTCVATSASRGS